MIALSLAGFYGHVRYLASHWGALQLLVAGGGLTLFVGLPGMLSIASSVHPLLALLSTLSGAALLAVTAASVVAVRSLLDSDDGPRLPWVSPRTHREPPAVLSEDVRWRADADVGLLPECAEHRVELMYRRFRLGWRGRMDGRVEPVREGHAFGRKGTLYCPATGAAHRVRVPDSASFDEAKQRALVLLRARAYTGESAGRRDDSR